MQLFDSCTTVEQLHEQVQQQHGSNMMHAHAAAAMFKLVQVAASSARQEQEPPQEAVVQLAGYLEAMLLHPGQLERCSPEQPARTAWCCGWLADARSTTLPLACVAELVRQLQHISIAKQVSMALNGAAKCGVVPPAQHVQQLVVALLRPDVLATASTQAIGNTLCAVATMRQQQQQAQELQLMGQVQLQPAAQMQLLLAEQVGQLVAELVRQRQQAKPQELADTLVPVANMQQQLSAEHLRQLVDALLAKA